LEGNVGESQSYPQARVTVLLGPISIPPEVDRNQIAVREGIGEIVLSEQRQWATPLKDALPRLLAAQLDIKLPGSRFVPTSSAAMANPKGRLSVDIERFEVSRSGGAIVSAHWVYRSSVDKTPPIEGDSNASAEVASAGYDGLVTALRLASRQIATNIATQLSEGDK
jgi:uncharacterized lipoprotein YmbA